MMRITFVTKVDVPQLDVVRELLPVTWTFLVLRLHIVNGAHRVCPASNRLSEATFFMMMS